MRLIGRLNLNALHILGLTLRTPLLEGRFGVPDGVGSDFWKPSWCPCPVAPSSAWISIREIQGNEMLFMVFGLALRCITPGKPSKDILGEKLVLIPSHSLKTHGLGDSPFSLW